ncbi:MAG: dockerin type I repeat-containing protein [Candidatus Zixiibacteriota bacterium]|jgi:hypothetical protein
MNVEMSWRGALLVLPLSFVMLIHPGTYAQLSFCDGFENDWSSNWTNTEGGVVVATTPVHSGAKSIGLSREAQFFCWGKIYRNDFSAIYGEYSVWANHQTGSTDNEFAIQVPIGMTDGGYRVRFVPGTTFILQKGITPVSSIPVILQSYQWFQVFIRREAPNIITYGYRMPDGSGDSLNYLDPSPIMAPGTIVLQSCEDGNFTYFDDVCFEALSTDTSIEFSLDSLNFSRPAGHDYDTTIYLKNNSDFPIDCYLEHTPFIPYSVDCSYSEICTVPAHDSIPVTFVAYTEGLCYPPVGAVDTITVMLLVEGVARDLLQVIETVTLNQPPCKTRIIPINQSDSVHIGSLLSMDFEVDCPHGLAEDCFQRLDLSYSIDNMSSWVPIDSNIIINSYDWMVPNILGCTFYLRIEGTDWYMVPVLDSTGPFSVYYLCGDANANCIVNILDVTYLISYLYKGGPAPIPLESGDANGNGTVNILDVTYLLAYLYKDGNAPICPPWIGPY